MKEFFLLWFLDKFKAVFTELGINYGQLRLILKLKLTLDARNVTTAAKSTRKDGKQNLSLLSLVVYTIMGFFISSFLWMSVPVFYKMNIIIGMIMFMLMMIMMSDFSTVLLDVKDKNILSPRPIDGKTLKLAKSIHIMYYLSRISLALAGPPLIMSLIRYGRAFFLVFFVEIIFISVLVVFLTALLYFAILRIFDGEKLKDIINYFQVGFTIIMSLSYQFIGRMFGISELTITFTPHWWHCLIPTAWFAAPFSMMGGNEYPVFYGVSSALAVAVPTLVFITYIKVIAPYFEINLQKLNENSGKGRRRLNAFGVHEIIATVICRDRKERAFYRFARNMLSSERKLKLQLYPSLALSAALPFILIFFSGAKGSFSEILNSLPTSRSFMFVYFAVALTSMSVLYISRSEKHQGAWIYKALPIENPALALKGAFKAFVFRFNIPINVLLCLICVGFWGVRIVPDVLLMLANMLLLTTVTFAMSARHGAQMPFSMDFDGMQGTTTGMTFLLLAAGVVAAALHLGMSFIPFGVAANIAVSLIATMIVWQRSFKSPILPN